MLLVCTLLSKKMIISLREDASEVVIANPYNAVLENWKKTKEYPPVPIVASVFEATFNFWIGNAKCYVHV